MSGDWMVNQADSRRTTFRNDDSEFMIMCRRLEIRLYCLRSANCQDYFAERYSVSFNAYEI
jgi:hypothetical protein